MENFNNVSIKIPEWVDYPQACPCKYLMQFISLESWSMCMDEEQAKVIIWENIFDIAFFQTLS